MAQALVGLLVFLLALIPAFIWAYLSTGFQAGDYVFSILLSIFLLSAVPLFFGLRDARDPA